jgi:hypothetical protein
MASDRVIIEPAILNRLINSVVDFAQSPGIIFSNENNNSSNNRHVSGWMCVGRHVLSG